MVESYWTGKTQKSGKSKVSMADTCLTEELNTPQNAVKMAAQTARSPNPPTKSPLHHSSDDADHRRQADVKEELMISS